MGSPERDSFIRASLRRALLMAGVILIVLGTAWLIYTQWTADNASSSTQPSIRPASALAELGLELSRRRVVLNGLQIANTS